MSKSRIPTRYRRDVVDVKLDRVATQQRAKGCHVLRLSCGHEKRLQATYQAPQKTVCSTCWQADGCPAKDNVTDPHKADDRSQRNRNQNVSAKVTDTLKSPKETETRAKRKQFTSEQIITCLRQVARGEQTVEAACEKHGVSTSTFYRWRRAHGDKGVSAVYRLKRLEAKITRLKRMLAESNLALIALKERIRHNG